MVMVLIAGVESGLLAAISTSALAVAGQGADGFSAFSQWALYAYAGTLCATLLAHMMAAASMPAGREPGFWGEVVAATSDAQCSVAFLALACYAVGFSKSILMLHHAPKLPSGGAAVNGYAVTPHDSWYMAVVGGAYASWENDATPRVSSLLRLGPNGTASSILAQVFAGAVLAYLLVMLLAATYVSYTASNNLAGRAPRLFLDSASLSTCNAFVVLVLREAVEEGFQGCKYAGTTANGVGAMLAVAIFVALDAPMVYAAGWAFEIKDREKKRLRAGLATLYAAIPTAIALARNTGRGDEPVLLASLALWALATASAWARHDAPRRPKLARADAPTFDSVGATTIRPLAEKAALHAAAASPHPRGINWTLASGESLLPTLASLSGASQSAPKQGRYVA